MRALHGRAAVVGAVLTCLLLIACSGPAPHSTPTPRPSGSVTPSAPRPDPRSSTPGAPDHVVVLILENHTFDQVLRAPDAPYFRQLMGAGRSLTEFYAITHPSQPNYLALFSGSTQGVRDDSCPHRLADANLGSELRAHGYSFTGYAEGLPRAGWTGCTHGDYARKHAPWVNFTDLPGAISEPMTDFPTDYTTLPTVSFVIPNLQHDMHNGTLAEADSWTRTNLSGYVTWAKTHNSILVVTADEDDKSDDNRIPALVVGDQVAPGHDAHHYTLYSLLRTIEDWYGLPPLGHSAAADPLRDLRSP